MERKERKRDGTFFVYTIELKLKLYQSAETFSFKIRLNFVKTGKP